MKMSLNFSRLNVNLDQIIAFPSPSPLSGHRTSHILGYSFLKGQFSQTNALSSSATRRFKDKRLIFKEQRWKRRFKKPSLLSKTIAVLTVSLPLKTRFITRQNAVTNTIILVTLDGWTHSYSTTRAKDRKLTLIDVLPSLAAGDGNVICTLMEAWIAVHTACPRRVCSAAASLILPI